MKQEEKLKEAFARAAIGETQRLEKSLTAEERRKAEALYKHHRETVLRQIRRKRHAFVKWAVGTAAAAAVLLLAVRGLNRPAPDIITPAADPAGTGIAVLTNEPQPSETAVTQTAAPASDVPVLEAVLTDFPEGKRYAVYTGPGTYYERANQNKAAVSTNDWIRVFGVENGYALIQYAIDDETQRIGYIDAAALPDSASADSLTFGYIPVVIPQETELTDDPLGGKTPLHTLPAGTEAQWLAVLDDWAYLEWQGAGQPVRGFVPREAIQQENAR